MNKCFSACDNNWQAERGLLDALKIRKRIWNPGQVPDKHLAKLHRCSMAFVYLSMYEGFGIPPLEAMSCGTVVIAAAVSSLPMNLLGVLPPSGLLSIFGCANCVVVSSG
jgi:glycosyltransferase involved in cell wall biosynthesis